MVLIVINMQVRIGRTRAWSWCLYEDHLWYTLRPDCGYSTPTWTVNPIWLWNMDMVGLLMNCNPSSAVSCVMSIVGIHWAEDKRWRTVVKSGSGNNQHPVKKAQVGLGRTLRKSIIDFTMQACMHYKVEPTAEGTPGPSQEQLHREEPASTRLEGQATPGFTDRFLSPTQKSDGVRCPWTYIPWRFERSVIKSSQ